MVKYIRPGTAEHFIFALQIMNYSLIIQIYLLIFVSLQLGIRRYSIFFVARRFVCNFQTSIKCLIVILCFYRYSDFN